MDTWDNDFLGFVEKAHISFRGRANGRLRSAPSMAISMFATASAKVRPVRSSAASTAIVPPLSPRR